MFSAAHFFNGLIYLLICNFTLSVCYLRLFYKLIVCAVGFLWLSCLRLKTVVGHLEEDIVFF